MLQPAEKEALVNAAQVMYHYGLSFVPATGDEGGIRLEPYAIIHIYELLISK